MGMNQRIQNTWETFAFCCLLLFLFGWHHIGGRGGAFTLVGLPILYYVLRSTSVFVQYERIQAKVYTNISIDRIPSRTRVEEGLW